MARLRERLPAERDADQQLAAVKQPAAADAEEVAQLKASLLAAEAQIEALNADLAAAKGELETVREQPAAQPAEAADGPQDGAGNRDELARLRAELRAANQRLGELEEAIRLGLATLAPLPPPPAPR